MKQNLRLHFVFEPRGQIIEVQPEPSALKEAYRLTVDFGKFGKRTSVGRFTKHSVEEIKGKKIMGVLNFEPRLIGDVLSEVLILGVQYPKVDSGEATFNLEALAIG